MLAQEASTNGDLLNIKGGCWDTITVEDGPDEYPEGAQVGGVPGVLVTRIGFHQVMETNRQHHFRVALVDEHGEAQSAFMVPRAPNVPVSWPQRVNLILPLGMGAPHFGTYTFALEVDGRHVGDGAFRVVDGRKRRAA